VVRIVRAIVWNSEQGSQRFGVRSGFFGCEVEWIFGLFGVVCAQCRSPDNAVRCILVTCSSAAYSLRFAWVE